ncbi:phosphatase PAP2 family protein [Micromonospora sp. KC723]|uniref:phosphatase PAP2 family protein n=1 Tax=Micromonospora sp. KC723 TaxID=2530381 RepID=UPI001050D665|nr:phosphatase PAP2 family protein [Micromonospora sp. KC723]TDB76508.1 phosphatase PAP2 family protein [Micromonospora sp. KC723]
MILIYALGALSVVLPLVLVPALARRVPAVRAGRPAWRLRVAVAGLTDAFGRVGAALVLLLAGCAAVVAVCWPLGEALARLEPQVDHPVFEYVHARRVATWAELNSFYTALGDRYPLKWVTGVAALVFAVLWRRRQWWVPLLAMPLQFIVEQYVQAILATMVDRGHPPTDLGTYPSGGCARIMSTFGTIAVLAMLTWRIPRAGRVALMTGVVTLVSMEGYTRIYAEKHWLTDVIGGWIFAVLLFGVTALALLVAEGRIRPPVPRAVPVRESVPTGG